MNSQFILYCPKFILNSFTIPIQDTVMHTCWSFITSGPYNRLHPGNWTVYTKHYTTLIKLNTKNSTYYTLHTEH